MCNKNTGFQNSLLYSSIHRSGKKPGESVSVFLKLCSCQNHLSHRSLSSTPELLFQWVWSKVQEPTLPAGSQVMLWEPHIENHWSTALRCYQGSWLILVCVSRGESQLQCNWWEGSMLRGISWSQTLHSDHGLNPISPGHLLQPMLTQKQRSLRFVWLDHCPLGKGLLLRIPKEVVCKTSPSSFQIFTQAWAMLTWKLYLRMRMWP